MTTFGDIRSVAQRAPGVGTWWDLCDAFESYDGAEPLEDRVIPYCAAQLARWPVTVSRSMPSSWLEALCRGERVPVARLANAITNWRNFDEGKLAALAGAAEIEGVRVLELSRGYSGSDGFFRQSVLAPDVVDDAFADTFEGMVRGPLRRVEVCVLGGTPIGPRVARALASMPALTSLTLEACPHDEDALAVLAAGPFDALVDLCVDCWAAESLEVILESSWFHRLESLSWRGCRLVDSWVASVFDDPVVSNLRMLDLGANNLTTDALCSVLTSPALTRLERLYISRLNDHWSSLSSMDQCDRLRAAFERMASSRLEELGLRESSLDSTELSILRDASRTHGFEFAFTYYRDNLT